MPGLFRPGAGALLLALLVPGLLFYANAIPHPFVHDDIVYIQLNPYIGGWDHIGDIFFNPRLIFAQTQTPYYRPLLEVIYRLEYALFGLNAWGFHLVNVLLHSLNAWLLLLIATRLRVPRSWAWMIAAVFLLHPLQSEAVACVSGISNLAVAFLMLAAFYGYLLGRAGRRGAMAAAGVMMALALFAKEQALLMPLVLLTYEMLYRREPWRLRLRTLLPFALLALGFALWRAHLFPGLGAEAFANIHEFKLRLASMARIILMDLRLAVFPSGLHYFRSVDILAPKLASWLLLAVLTLAFLGASSRLAPSSRRLFWMGLGLAGITLLPGLNIYPLVNEYSWVLNAEHFLYLPLAGLLLALAALLGPFLQRQKLVLRRGLVALGLILLAVMGLLTVFQNHVWRGEVPLFERSVHYEPELGRVRMLLARAYAREGRFREAERESSAALRVFKKYVRNTRRSPAQRVYLQFLKANLEDRGLYRLRSGDAPGAREDLYRAQALASMGVSSAVFGGNDRAVAYQLGVMAHQRRDDALARFWFRKANGTGVLLTPVRRMPARSR